MVIAADWISLFQPLEVDMLKQKTDESCTVSDFRDGDRVMVITEKLLIGSAVLLTLPEFETTPICTLANCYNPTS